MMIALLLLIFCINSFPVSRPFRPSRTPKIPNSGGIKKNHRHKLNYIYNGGSTNLIKRPFYHPKPVFETFGKQKVFHSSSVFDENTILSFAFEYTCKKLGIQSTDLNITSYFTDAVNVTHCYMKHLISGIEVSNHHASIHLRGNNVLAFSSSFNLSGNLEKRNTIIEKSRVLITEDQAIDIVLNEFHIPIRESYPVKLKYIEIPGGNLIFAYVIQCKEKSNWIQVFIDSSNGEILHVVDFISSATYRVVQFKKLDPVSGLTLEIDPENHEASPYGWHNSTREFTNTQGNNVRTYIVLNPEHKRYYSEGGKTLDFVNGVDTNQPPNQGTNRDASITNLFYIINMMHDLLFQYGFTAAAGNFQFVNYEPQGLAGDGVIARAQESTYFNGGDFSTSPDGEPGEMNMYLFDITDPKRDGALENDIPIHEMQHGVSNRLTGGASNAECLEDEIAAGLDEGWSDAMAIFINRNENHTRQDNAIMGEYVGNGKGIRTMPYSTNMNVNNLTYSSLNVRSESHAVGEIWTVMFFEVFWNLVDSFGFSSNLFNSKDRSGNIVSIQLLMAGLSLQPCQPTFISARNAILQGDLNYYNGKHKCQIWRGFAKRGLGENATEDDYIDDFGVPIECI